MSAMRAATSESLRKELTVRFKETLPNDINCTNNYKFDAVLYRSGRRILGVAFSFCWLDSVLVRDIRQREANLAAWAAQLPALKIVYWDGLPLLYNSNSRILLEEHIRSIIEACNAL
jgi:hypothetical protein